MRERQPRGVQELAPQAVLAGGRRTGGSPHTGWPIAAMCTRIWWVRPVSSATRTQRAAGSSRSSSKWVRASRGRVACRSTSAPARGGGGRSARRSSPCVPAGGRRPGPDTRAAAGARRAAPSAPDGPPRSWRRPAGPTCRGRGGARSRLATVRRRRLRVRRAPARAFRSSGRAPGCTTTPAGLSTTIRCSSS